MSIRIDPSFDLPEGLNGLVYEDEPVEEFDVQEEVGDFDETQDESGDSDVVVPPPVGGGGEGVLLPPDNCQVVEQILRINADGKVVVDVICELDDSGGSTQYDAKVAIR